MREVPHEHRANERSRVMVSFTDGCNELQYEFSVGMREDSLLSSVVYVSRIRRKIFPMLEMSFRSELSSKVFHDLTAGSRLCHTF